MFQARSPSNSATPTTVGASFRRSPFTMGLVTPRAPGPQAVVDRLHGHRNIPPSPRNVRGTSSQSGGYSYNSQTPRMPSAQVSGYRQAGIKYERNSNDRTPQQPHTARGASVGRPNPVGTTPTRPLGAPTSASSGRRRFVSRTPEVTNVDEEPS